MDEIRVYTSPPRSVPNLGRPVVYACRHCRDAVRVRAQRYLPEACPGCNAATWDAEGECANWERCDAVRRPGIRGRSHCHACGYSIWVLVGVEESGLVP